MSSHKTKKESISIKSIFRLLKFFSPFKLLSSFFIISVVISAILSIITPNLVGDLINLITKNSQITPHGIKFNPDFAQIGHLGILLIALFIVSAGFNYLKSWMMAKMSQTIVFNMRDMVTKKISRLPLSFFDSKKTGDIVSVITNDIETVSSNLGEVINQIAYTSIVMIGTVIMMIKISPEMSLVTLATGVISVISTFIITKFSQVYFTDLQKHTGDITGHVEEMLSSHEVIKAYNGENISIDEFEKINERVFSSSWKSQFFGGLIYPFMNSISSLSSLAVAVVGGIRAINGDNNIGDILAFMQYMNMFTQSFSQISNSMTQTQTILAAGERVFDILDAEEEKAEVVTQHFPDVINGEVSFEKVNFSYHKNKPIIKDFTAKIQPRSNVAIVGHTGAGKTTLVNLLMRFYDIDSGKIKIDGIDTSKVSRQDVRSLFGMVLQDTWLFNGTIADNLKYGKSDATDEEIVEAAKKAHADHFIRTLPDGYNTLISQDADNISAGEKQLLTIARAILADSPMLILDEATSSVDTRTEAAIQKAMDNLTHGRTSFVIAHRLSTIRNANLILVMDKGNIVEQGTHSELLELNGAYAKLYNAQFEQ